MAGNSNYLVERHLWSEFCNQILHWIQNQPPVGQVQQRYPTGIEQLSARLQSFLRSYFLTRICRIRSEHIESYQQQYIWILYFLTAGFKKRCFWSRCTSRVHSALFLFFKTANDLKCAFEFRGKAWKRNGYRQTHYTTTTAERIW